MMRILLGSTYRRLTPRRFHTSRLPLQQVGCGTAVDSSWEWLKDPESPRLQSFLKLERNYMANQLCNPKFRNVERAFNVELRNRLLREDCSIPERIGKFEYFMRQAPGENFPVYYRRLCNATATSTVDEQVVLNQNIEPLLTHDFQFVSGMKISPDTSQLLLVMENDKEQCQVVLKDLESGKMELLRDVVGVKNVEWSSTLERMFYFTKVDGHGRPFAVYRYNLMTQTQNLIYEEQDKAFFVDVSQTKDRSFVLINCNSKNTSEIHALDGHNIDAQLQLLRPREAGTLYFADHTDGQFYIVTNAEGALNYKVVTCSMGAEDGQWKTFVPEHEEVKIEDVDLFKNYLVLYERVNSVPRIRVFTLGEQSVMGYSTPHYYIPLPKEHEICRVLPGVNREYTAHHVRFQVSTPLVPEIVYDYDMKSRKLQVLKETKLTENSAKQNRSITNTVTKSSFEPKRFTCQRCYVPSMSSLGVKIPLTLVHRRDITLNGQNPTLLIGYGAYGTNLEADFELEHLSLLERGWVIALAHVRGGGEFGLPWYHAGFTNPKRLAGKGVSAGGLIMGYVANEYPQLYQALVMKVPFVDILATMQDPTLPLTVHEYDEWGDPNGPNAYEYIRSYAPCENVRENQVYPAMFVTGSLNDQRVQFWEPAKWMYKMRKVQASLPKRDKRLMMLKMGEDDGHFGGGGRLEQLDESAVEIAFLYQALRLPFPPE